MKLASMLLVLVALTHYGYPILAQAHLDPDAAARAWFYVLRGIEGAVLFAVLAVILKSNPGAAMACWWGCIENSLTAVCRLSSGIDNPVTPAEFQGLCGAQTGMPLWQLTLAVVCFFIFKGGAWTRQT